MNLIIVHLILNIIKDFDNYYLIREVKAEENLDLKTIARKLDGYSGADITNVCRDASMMSMRKKIAGLKPMEIRNLAKEELDLPVTKDVSCSLLGIIFITLHYSKSWPYHAYRILSKIEKIFSAWIEKTFNPLVWKVSKDTFHTQVIVHDGEAPGFIISVQEITIANTIITFAFG